MINTYEQYQALVKDIEREKREEEYCKQHGMSLPLERISLLTAAACFESEDYENLVEDIVFYENIDTLVLSDEEYFNTLEEEDDYNLTMQEELAWYNHARQLGWE